MGEDGVIVLGVGNTLMQDDGIGVKVVHALAEQYELPAQVRLIDGGVAGFAWLEELAAARHLMIVDAVRGDEPPGSLYRLTGDDLTGRSGPTISPHEVGLAEVLGMAELLGQRPQTLILGVQPAATDAPGMQLTAQLEDALPRVVATVVAELAALGIIVARKQYKVE